MPNFVSLVFIIAEIFAFISLPTKIDGENNSASFFF